jgi:hypothetical protein
VAAGWRWSRSVMNARRFMLPAFPFAVAKSLAL